MSAEATRGIVYVAWGETYVAEAVASAKQVRRVMQTPIVLITADEAVETQGVFDKIIVTPFNRTYRDKILMALAPFDRVIFLDSDTFVLESLDQLFHMLERFDVVYQASAPSTHYTLPDVPMLALEEPSAGIIAWRRNDATRRFFEQWAADYDEQERANGNGAWDQRSMRSALWRSEVNLYALGRDWQLYSFEAGIAMNKVRMVHGRGRPATDAIASCNRRIGPRAYVPGIGFFRVWGATPGDYLGLSMRAGRMALKRGLRLLLAKTGIWPLPANQRQM